MAVQFRHLVRLIISAGQLACADYLQKREITGLGFYGLFNDQLNCAEAISRFDRNHVNAWSKITYIDTD